MGGSSKAQTVGYRYSFDIHFALGKAMDELMEIRASGKTAWKGSVTENTTITINAPNLFGGDKGEGGIQGKLDVMFGAEDQPVNANLAAALGGLVPAFRGFVGGFYSGLVTSINPYPKPWKILRNRALKGWDGAVWYPETCAISLAAGTITAMNPAHILYETYTNRDWGRGLDRSVMDDAAWRAAALKLYDEGFGLCLEWKTSTSLAEFRDQVCNHIGAYAGPDRRTGLITITLIRDDYSVEDLPLFDEDSGLLSIEEDEANSAMGAPSQLIVEYVDAVTGETRRARAVNSAIAQAQGGPSAETVSYPGLPTAELAGRVAGRDMRVKGSNLRKFKLKLDRRGVALAPGSVFRVRSLKRGIQQIVLRAGKIEDGTLSSGTITVTGLQDVFGLPGSSFVAVPPSGYVPPDRTPMAIQNARLIEATYRELAGLLDSSALLALDISSTWMTAVAIQPSGLSLSYTITNRIGVSGDFVERATGDWCPSGQLVAALLIGATEATITNGVDLDRVTVGQAALLDDEIVRVDAFDLATGVVSLGRGCIDTVPASHAAGTRIWFYDGFSGVDDAEYSAGLSLQARLLTNTSSGQLDSELATTETLELLGRQGRPYPPVQISVNGELAPVSIDGELTIAWLHRDRLMQADQLVDSAVGSIGPEPGTTYVIRAYDAAQLLVHESAPVTGNSYTVEFGHSGQLRVAVSSVRDGLECWQVPEVSFLYSGVEPPAAPFMVTEGEETLITELGAPFGVETFGAGTGPVKISELPAAGAALDGDELLAIVQSGETVRITTGDLLTFVAGQLPPMGPTRVRSVSGSSYTLSAVDDAGAWLECTATTVRLPETVGAGFEVDDIVEVRQSDASVVNFVADTAGVTMAFDVTKFQPMTRYAGGVVALKVISTNTWALVGALADV